MKRIIITGLVLIAVTAVIATAGQDTKSSMPMMHEAKPMMHRMMNDSTGMMVDMMKDSPMNIPGVEVTVADTPNGATVSFTTTTGDVAELRRLVRAHVEMMKNMKTGMMTGSKSSSKRRMF
jgi:hypothetical protein